MQSLSDLLNREVVELHGSEDPVEASQFRQDDGLTFRSFLAFSLFGTCKDFLVPLLYGIA